jgi:hypothetical protein
MFDVRDSFEFEKSGMDNIASTKKIPVRVIVFCIEGLGAEWSSLKPTGLGNVRSALRLTRELA